MSLDTERNLYFCVQILIYLIKYLDIWQNTDDTIFSKIISYVDILQK